MLTVIYQHCGWGTGCDDNPPERLQLPVSICESEIRILRSDCCETIVQPAIDSNSLQVLRRALTEWGYAEWLDLDEQVEVLG
jgi:hypothetical protein